MTVPMAAIVGVALYALLPDRAQQRTGAPPAPAVSPSAETASTVGARPIRVVYPSLVPIAPHEAGAGRVDDVSARPPVSNIDANPTVPPAVTNSLPMRDQAKAGQTTVRNTADQTADDHPAAPGPTVNINNASIEALDHLAGAGRIGLMIVKHRPYRSIEDLLRKRVLRKSVYEKIRDHVAVQ